MSLATYDSPELGDERERINGAASVCGDSRCVFARRNFRLQCACMVAAIGQAQHRIA
jgi:hypothetical protein